MPGQLDLFTRRIARKPPSAKEFATQCLLADICRRWINAGWRFTHLPFGEARSPITGARLKRMGTNRGWPDFIFVGPGSIVFLELKRRGAKLKPEQREIAAHISECGFVHLSADSFPVAVDLLKRHGVLQSRISA